MSKAGYPIWWDTSITIYNKTVDKQTQVVMWYRTVLTDCFWQLRGNEVVISNVELDSKSIVCRIPKSPNFKEKFEWLQLPNDQKQNYFTLGLDDIIIKGAVDDEIDEYTAGQRSTDLLKKYAGLQGCFKIRQFTNNTGIGRNNEHYLAQGI